MALEVRDKDTGEFVKVIRDPKTRKLRKQEPGETGSSRPLGSAFQQSGATTSGSEQTTTVVKATSPPTSDGGFSPSNANFFRLDGASVYVAPPKQEFRTVTNSLPINTFMTAQEFAESKDPRLRARRERLEGQDVPRVKGVSRVDAASVAESRRNDDLVAGYLGDDVFSSASSKQQLNIAAAELMVAADVLEEKFVTSRARNPGINSDNILLSVAAGTSGAVAGTVGLLARPVKSGQAITRGVADIVVSEVNRPKSNVENFFQLSPLPGSTKVAALLTPTVVKSTPAVLDSVYNNPFEVVADIVIFDKGLGAVTKGVKSTRFVGKSAVRAAEVVDPQSLLGVADDLTPTRFPKATKGGQSIASDRLVSDITSQGEIFQAAPTPIPTSRGATGKQQFTILTQEDKVAAGLDLSETGGMFASDKTSSAFLGLSGESEFVELGLPGSGSPSIQRVKSRAKRLPVDSRRSFDEANIFIDDPVIDGLPAATITDTGTSFVSPAREVLGKTEKEVILAGGNVAVRSKKFGKVQSALGKDFDEFTLVPLIPDGPNRVATGVEFIDPDSGLVVKTAPGQKFIEFPVPLGLTPVPIRDFDLIQGFLPEPGDTRKLGRAVSKSDVEAARLLDSSSLGSPSPRRSTGPLGSVVLSGARSSSGSSSEALLSSLSSSASKSSSSSVSSSGGFSELVSSGGSSSGSSSSSFFSSSGGSGGSSSGSSDPFRELTSSGGSSSKGRSSGGRRGSGSSTPGTPLTPPPKKPPRNDGSELGLGKNYIGETKRKGKWVRASKKTTATNAYKAALDKARSTPAASARIRTGETIVDPGELGFSIPNDFRRSKRQKNVLVETNKKRINTSGELLGITFSPNNPNNRSGGLLF